MTELHNKILTIEPTVSYMLKVIKSGRAIIKYNEEFKAIRHGNYFEFINIVKGKVPSIVTYKNGIVSTENSANKDDCDFAGLIKAGPSLLKFYKACFLEYGQFSDSDLPDETFCKTVLFELSLRMHANNNRLLNAKEKLENVIEKLSDFKNLSYIEKAKLHLGRRFLNMIKHPKNQFPTWIEGIDALNNAYQILVDNKITII